MRIATFADIHGNAWALEQVLADIALAAPDLVLFLGDALIRVPAPRQTMDLLMGVEHQAVRGNYDWFITGGFPGEERRLIKEPFLIDEIAWIKQQLRADQLKYIADLPLTLRFFTGTPQEIVVCHASPGRVFGGLFPSPQEHHQGMTDEQCLDLLQGEAAPLAICGHTHAVMDRRVGEYRIVNPGAVSLGWNEYDQVDGLAHWALLTWCGTEWQVEHRTAGYDHRAVWQSYSNWELWPYMRQFDKPLWWGEKAHSFAEAIVCNDL